MFHRRSLLLSAVGIAALPRSLHAATQDFDVPYVPTPNEVVEGMLDMAALRPGEQLIDLGSGDGRIAIAAARRGATALGIEINAKLVARARLLAQMAGQETRARFQRADLFTVSLRSADVVTLYLLPDVNQRLKSRLLVELKPGARVVSHAFDMGDWTPDIARTVAEKNLYRWTIPAIAGGEWRVTHADGTTVPLHIQQRYSRVTGTLGDREIAQPRLTGRSLSFTAGGIAYHGIVDDRSIEGESPARWRADRID